MMQTLSKVFVSRTVRGEATLMVVGAYVFVVIVTKLVVLAKCAPTNSSCRKFEVPTFTNILHICTHNIFHLFYAPIKFYSWLRPWSYMQKHMSITVLWGNFIVKALFVNFFYHICYR